MPRELSSIFLCLLIALHPNILSTAIFCKVEKTYTVATIATQSHGTRSRCLSRERFGELVVVLDSESRDFPAISRMKIDSESYEFPLISRTSPPTATK